MVESEIKETKEWLKDFIRMFSCNFDDLENRSFNEIVLYLEEIQQYRAIGTVEDIQLIFSLCKDLERMVKKYEAIGTVEEFKALKEKETEILLKDGQLLYQQGLVDGYAKAIDEFAEVLKADLQGEHWTQFCTMRKFIDDIAEQMKGEKK